MKTRILLSLVIFSFLNVSCRKNESSAEIASNYEESKVYCLQKLSPPITKNEYNPKLIKKGDVTISTLNVESTKNLVYGFVNKCGGYIANEVLVANEPDSYYQISLNIQASNFEKFIHMLDSSGLNIVSRNFSVQDVTMQYIDNTTRMENKKKLEKRYLDLLTKTKDIKDILEIEGKLEEIRTEIEIKESQLKVMEKQIAYSVFDIKIVKTASELTISDKNKYSYKIKQGLAEGWESVKNFALFLFSIWPFYILIAIVFIALKKIFQRIKKNK